VVITWTLAEVAICALLAAAMAMDWNLGEILALVFRRQDAPLWAAIGLAGFIWLGDLAVLLRERWAWASYQRRAGRRPRMGIVRFVIHLLPGVGLARHLVFAGIWIGLVLAHIVLLLVWDVAFLLLALPLSVFTPVSGAFGRSTDKLDEVREGVTLMVGKLYRATDPFPVRS
jgi:hypothetical protein